MASTAHITMGQHGCWGEDCGDDFNSEDPSWFHVAVGYSAVINCCHGNQTLQLFKTAGSNWNHRFYCLFLMFVILFMVVPNSKLQHLKCFLFLVLICTWLLKFGTNFIDKKSHTDTHTHKQTHTHTGVTGLWNNWYIWTNWTNWSIWTNWTPWTNWGFQQLLLAQREVSELFLIFMNQLPFRIN